MNPKDKQKKDDKKSVGTQIGEMERKRANRFSDAKKQQLLERGMAVIYGGQRNSKAAVNR